MTKEMDNIKFTIHNYKSQIEELEKEVRNASARWQTLHDSKASVVEEYGIDVTDMIFMFLHDVKRMYRDNVVIIPNVESVAKASVDKVTEWLNKMLSDFTNPFKRNVRTKEQFVIDGLYLTNDIFYLLMEVYLNEDPYYDSGIINMLNYRLVITPKDGREIDRIYEEDLRLYRRESEMKDSAKWELRK